MSVFSPTDILLPTENISPELWSVVACDQFTSEREYWERVRKRVGESPSTLNMIIPEVYLDEIDEKSEITKIRRIMDSYVSNGLFRKITDSFIYVERTLSNGQVRKGLVGALDLEEYDFSIGIIGENTKNQKTHTGVSAVLASEGTLLDRLPPRIRVRQAAMLELPHIMVFIVDEDQTVIETLANKVKRFELLYDFELMEGGGFLRGSKISGSDSTDVMKAISALNEEKRAKKPMQCMMIMGDGNHSLAAASSYWNEKKKNLSPNESKSHPARYALVEINNLYDPAIHFEAIHRVIFDVDADKFVAEISATLASAEYRTPDNARTIKILTTCGEKSIAMDVCSASELIAAVQEFLDAYIAKSGGRIDYVHEPDTIYGLAKDLNCVGILLPHITKQEFFETVSARKILPRKSFSIGHAEDKRYYMECRKIQKEVR